MSLDAFEMGPQIAQGGVGRVYRGRHRATGEVVAIKVLSPTVRPEHRAAFEREANAMAGFDHPHLLPVYEYGHTTNGSPFMVMPLAEHGDLHAYAKHLDWLTAGTILVQMLQGLAHAHAHGVVHCDLKPENVLLRSARDGVRAQLADFGIAQALRTAEGTRQVQGTPSYMAPEQLVEPALIGPATDLYALGCIAFELTTRTLPFTGRTALAVGTAQVNAQPARWVDAVGAPSGLQGWITRCLAKAPRARWPGAAEALAALRPFIPAGSAVLPEADPQAPTDSTQVSMAGLTPPPQPHLSEMTTRLPPPPSWRTRVPTEPAIGLGLRLFGARARPLVGRDAEADVLWRRVQGAHARESARVVIIEGAQGTGKSHLAGWIGARADELGAARLLTARYADATPDTRGLTGLLRSILRSGSDLDRVRRLRGADQAGASDGTVHTLAFGGSRLPDRDPARVARVVISWLCQWAAPRVPYLWLDDAQWGDEPWWLAEAAIQLDQPIVVVLTVRDDAIGEHRQARLMRLQADRRVRRLALTPLPDAEHRALIEGLLPLAPDVVDTLTRRTHGRPLFAVHVVADWVARGLLEPTPDGWRPRADVEVASSLDALWLARITALLGETMAPDLGLAALLGERVDDALLGEAAALAGVAVNADRFHLLCRAGLARRLRRGWAFAHGLIRDAIAGRFGTPDLHAVCARALTAHVGMPADWRTVSEHWIKAGALDRAATTALHEYDGNIGSALRPDYQSGLTRIERMLDVLGASPQDARRLRIELRRVASGFATDAVTDLLDRIVAVEQAARAHGHLAEWGEALRIRAIVVRNSVGAAPAEPIFRQAAELLARAGDRRSAACAALGRVPCLRAMGRRTQAIETVREALAAFTALNDTWWMQTARMELAEVLNEIDAFDAAQTILEEALVLARATGDLINQARGLRRLAERPLAHGQFGLAESYLLQAGQFFEADGNINANYLPAWRARVALHRGELATACEFYAAYRRFSESVTYLDEMPWLAVIPAVDAAARGDDAAWVAGWDALTRQNTESWPAEARRDLAAAARLLPERHRPAVQALVAALALN